MTNTDSISSTEKFQEQQDSKYREAAARAALEDITNNASKQIETDLSSTNLGRKVIIEPIRIDTVVSKQTPEKSNTYTIKIGDNLTKIAKENSTSESILTVKELARLNGIENPNRIIAGKVIKLRADVPQASQTPQGVPVDRRSPPYIEINQTGQDSTQNQPQVKPSNGYPGNNSDYLATKIPTFPMQLSQSTEQKIGLTDSWGNSVTDGSGQPIQTGSNNNPGHGQIIPTPGTKPPEGTQKTEREKNNDTWYAAENAAKDYAKTNGYELKVEGTGFKEKNIVLDRLGVIPSRRNIDLIEQQKLSLIKDGKTTEIGFITPQGPHLGPIRSTDELKKQMISFIDSGIKKLETPQVQQAPEHSEAEINTMKSLFTSDITTALNRIGMSVLEGYKIQIPGGNFKMQNGTKSDLLSPDKTCTKIEFNNVKMLNGDTTIDFINSNGKNDHIRIDGKTGDILMKNGDAIEETKIGKLPKQSDLQQQINNFKNNKPSYIDVLAATDTEIKLKTIVPPRALEKGASQVRALSEIFDPILGEITLKTEKNDPFTKMEWSNIRLGDINMPADQLNNLKKAGFDINAPRSIANIESKKDQSLLIPARDGTGFATICPGGAVNIYNKGYSGVIARKPVIYLYPTKKTEISVSVKLSDATMIAEYPKTPAGKWKVEATPRGNLTDMTTNKKYSYLFWEAQKHGEFKIDTSNAHCIASGDITEYLEKSLKTLGLNARETNDFMVYWLPVLEQNPYSLIEWKTTEYTDIAKLHISPKPDSLIRIFMVFQKSDIEIKTGNPKLEKSRRSGYSVIEWGGCNMDEGSNIK